MSDFMQLLQDRDGWRDEYYELLDERAKLTAELESKKSEAEDIKDEATDYRKKYEEAIAAFASEHRQYLIQQRSLEYFQLKCINLQRREDGLEPYNTTAESAEAFIKETQADKKPEDLTLYGHKVIISNIPPAGHQLEHIIAPTAKQLREAYERIIEEYGTGPTEPEEDPDFRVGSFIKAEEAANAISELGKAFCISTKDRDTSKLGGTVTELGDVDIEDDGRYIGLTVENSGAVEVTLAPKTEEEAIAIAKRLGLYKLVKEAPKHPPRRKSKKTRKNHRKKKARVTNGNF
jgi:hypothetical protein|nr:MAG TPA: hypothetical protein [Caudoviricetes sp.]